MPIHTIVADFASYAPRRNRPLKIGRDETIDIAVEWKDGDNVLDITGGYLSAWLVDADKAETALPSTQDGLAGLQRIVVDPFTLAHGRYTLVARLTLNDVTRRAVVDLTVERAIGTLFSPPVAFESPEDVSGDWGAEVITVDGNDYISGATTWSVSGGGATVSPAGIVSIPTDALLDGVDIDLVGSNSALPAGVTVSFAATISAVEPAAMSAPIVAPATATSVTITLAADEPDGGSPITSRTLRYAVNGGADVVVTGLAEGASYMVTGLTEGDTVNASSRAINSVGVGLYGAAGTGITALRPDAPDAATIVGGINSITLTWPPEANLNGLALIDETYVVYDSSDVEISRAVRTGGSATTVISVPAQSGVYVTTFARTSAGSGDESLPSNSVTVSSGFVATVNELTRDMVVYDTGAARGLSVATVPVSGLSDAPDGQEIEARAIDEVGNPITSWTVVSTVAGSAWFGSLSVPRNVNWCRMEVRTAGSATSATATNRFAAGHVWDWWDQSNTHKLLQYNSNDEGYKEPAGYVDGDIQYASRDAADADNDVGTYVLLRSIVDGASKMPPGMQAMANAFAEARPGEKLMVRIHTLSGTSPHDTLTTLAEDATYGANGVRDWDDELAIQALDNSDGQYPGLVVVAGWHEWNSANSNTPGVFSKYFLSKDLDGNAVLPANENLPRFFDAANGGLYDWTKSRFFYMGPHGYASYSDPNTALPAASAVTDKAQLKGSTWTGDGEYAGLVTNARRLGGANTPEALPYRATTAGASRGFWDGTARDSQHMSSSFDGQVRHMRIQMHHILAAQGLINSPAPELDYRYDDPAGAYVDFGILGRNITTERLRRAAASELGSYPATIPDLSSYGATLSPTLDHRTEVMGITINSLSASRAEIQAGAGPSGEDVIRVYAEPGKTLSWQDAIGFGTGALPGYEVPEDYLDGVWLNWPVADVGSPILPGGVPVSHQGNDLIPNASAPDVFTVAGGATGTIFNSFFGDNWQTSTETAVRFEIVGSLAMETNTRYGLAHIHSGNAELYVDIGGSVVLTSAATNLTTPADTIVANQFYTIVAVVDMVTGAAWIEVDGVRLAEHLPGTSGLSGAFVSGRNPGFLRRTSSSSNGARAKGTFQHIKMWVDDADGIGAPFKVISGTAAVVNADPWKSGDNAV